MAYTNKRFTRVVVFIVAVALVAGAAFAVIRTTSSASPKRISIPAFLGVGAAPTVAQPFGPSAKQVSLADATSALGAPVILPHSALAPQKDVGATWMNSLSNSSTGESSVSVAVTFPADQLDIRYVRPAYSDPLANYESFVKAYPTGDQVISLHGQPALTQTSTHSNGTPWSSVEFVSRGTIISVMGYANVSKLEGIANAILNRAASS